MDTHIFSPEPTQRRIAESLYELVATLPLICPHGHVNPRMLAVTRSIGARIYKTHVTYRYLFDRTQPFERSPIIR